jgi:hypothetical protein
VISNIAVAAPGATTAVVTATTDVAAVVRVEYGLTTGYGSATADGPAGTAHSRTITGLAPSTLYHYRVRAANGALVTLSGDGTFTTAAAPVALRQPATYAGEVAWSSARTGVITVGTSTVGGPDQIGGLFSHYTWVPITPVVTDCTITRGRSEQDGAMSAGTMTLTLTDPDGDYNPENPASPLAPNVVPLRPIRFRATHLAAPYGLFFGWITRIEHDPSPTSQSTRIEAIDFFWWLDAFKPVISLPETTVGAAIRALVNACGLSDPAYLALDTGHAIPFLVADGSKSALALIQDLLAVDMGVFFVDGSGVVTYHDTARRYGPAAVDDTLTGAMIGGARPSTDVRQVRNGFTVTRLDARGQPAGPPQSAYDAESRDAARYGPRDGDPIQSPYLMSDTQAGSLARFKVLLHKDPVSPVRQVKLSNASDVLIAKQLARDLGDRVALTEPRGGTSTTGFIEGVQHRIWGAGKFHEVTYTITKRRFDFAVVGTAVVGDAIIGY